MRLDELARAADGEVPRSLEDLPPHRRHLGFDRVVGLLGEAWVAFVRTLDPALLEAVGVVHVSCDYAREVGPGPVEVTVEVTRLGTSSVALGLRVHQAGAVPVQATVVLVHKDFGAVRAVPLTAGHRALLAQHAAPEEPSATR